MTLSDLYIRSSFRLFFGQICSSYILVLSKPLINTVHIRLSDVHIKKIMKLLNFVSTLSFISGLSFEYKYPKLQDLILTFWCCINVVFLFGLITFLIQNINDITTIFQEIMYAIGMVMALTKALLYIPNRIKYLKLCTNVQNYVDKRIENGVSSYEQSEKQSYFCFLSFILAAFSIYSFIIAKPILFVLLQYIKGIHKSTDWYHPLPTVLFYDDSNSPGYEITYFIIILSWLGCAFFEITLDFMFLGISMQIITGYKDLQCMISELNKSIGNKNSKDFIIQIKQCIDFHDILLNCQNELQETNSSIICTSAVFLLLLLCSSLFRLSQFNNADFVANIALLVLIYIMLLIFCLMGNIMTSEGEKIAESAYNCRWYKCSPIERKYFFLLMQCGQKPRYLNGLHFFNCSMETYSNLVKASFSIVTIMKNLE